MCQTLIKRVVESALAAARLPVVNKVYFKDILLHAKKRRILRRGRGVVVCRFRAVLKGQDFFFC